MAEASPSAVESVVDRLLRRLDTFTVLLSPRFAGTWSLLGVIVLFYALEGVFGGTTDLGALTRLGALRTDLVVERGEWYRLLCPMFLHYGPIHLILNGLALVQLAASVEYLTGTARTISVYLVCGVAAALASAFLNDPLGNASVGASGAIMGLAGVLVGWSLYAVEPVRSGLRRLVLKRLVFAVGLTFALGIAVWLVAPVIDNWAHLGGFVAGLAWAAVMRDPRASYGPADWGTTGLLVGLTAFALGAMARDGGRATVALHADLAGLAWQRSLRGTDGSQTAVSLARMVSESHAAGDPERARVLLDARLAAMTDEDTPALLVGMLDAVDGAVAEQVAVSQRWVELAPDDAQAWNALAWSVLVGGDAERARPYADRALALLPDDADPVMRGAVLETHAQALRHTGDRAKALEEQREALALLAPDWWMWAFGVTAEVEARLREMEAGR